MKHYINLHTGGVIGLYKSAPPSGYTLMSTKDFDAFKSPALTAEQLAAVAQSEMQSELEWCDLMLKYIASGDTTRAEGRTADQMHAYAIACRDHVTSTNGVLAIIGTAPVRPI